MDCAACLTNESEPIRIDWPKCVLCQEDRSENLNDSPKYQYFGGAQRKVTNIAH